MNRRIMPQELELTAEHVSAAIVVGNELLQGHTQDSNTHWLAQRLYSLGYPLKRVHTVPDEREEIVRFIRQEVADNAEFVFVGGGLGPTPDDRTLESLGVALARPLVLDENASAHIQLRIDWLHGIGRIPTREMTEPNRRMALVPEGSVVLNNAVGMAPGLDITLAGDRHLFVLPGVPREFRSIFDEEIAPHYLGDGRPHIVEEVHFHMAIEAQFWTVLRHVETEFTDLTIGSYPQPERGHLIIRISGIDADRVHAAAEAVRAEAPAELRRPPGAKPE
jgi:molybdenum cofactor synthesis domain-containing protein